MNIFTELSWCNQEAFKEVLYKLFGASYTLLASCMPYAPQRTLWPLAGLIASVLGSSITEINSRSLLKAPDVQQSWYVYPKAPVDLPQRLYLGVEYLGASPSSC